MVFIIKIKTALKYLFHRGIKISKAACNYYKQLFYFKESFDDKTW